MTVLTLQSVPTTMPAALCVAVVLGVLLAAAAAAEAGGIVDTRHSPHAVVRPIGIGEVLWTEGFWADRFAICRDRSIPAMWEIMRGDHYKPYY
ncbi:MAG: hypothetical protein ABGY41_20630, partial [Candidatus Poribacteria bacterium]